MHLPKLNARSEMNKETEINKKIYHQPQNNLMYTWEALES